MDDCPNHERVVIQRAISVIRCRWDWDNSTLQLKPASRTGAISDGAGFRGLSSVLLVELRVTLPLSAKSPALLSMKPTQGNPGHQASSCKLLQRIVSA